MTDLRKFARDKPCMVRSPLCNGNAETTVLAHIRRANVAGMGQKPADIIGCWACSSCHNWIDGRMHIDSEDELRERDGYMLDALVRTLNELVLELGQPWAK